jgi:hypothetical protein
LDQLTDGTTLTALDNLHKHESVGAVAIESLSLDAIPIGMVVSVVYNALFPARNIWFTAVTTPFAPSQSPYPLGILLNAAAGPNSQVRIQTSGYCDLCTWDVAPGAADIGKPVYAADGSDGYVTLTAPTTPGQYRTRIGYLADASGGIYINIGETFPL